MQQIGKNQVVRLIGEGGMGRVYEATDPVLNRRVAIKTISGHLLQTPEARGRFLREAQAAGQLSHPNLITIHDIAEHDGAPFIVMEYLDGEELTGIITKRRTALDARLRMMIDVCQGLAYAHVNGLVHRDIKPANIFVTKQQHVKILDFGLARGLESDLTQTGNVVGTPSYMAPEQVRGEPIDQRADIFAAGVVLYELLSGRKPFSGQTTAATIYQVLEHRPQPVDELDPTIPGNLAKIVQRAIEKSPAARYQRIEEMAADLERIKIGADSTLILSAPAPSPARPPSVTHQQIAPVVPAAAPSPSPVQPQPVAGRKWGTIAIALVAVSVALLVLALRVFRSSEPATPAETPSATATTATPPPQNAPTTPAPPAAAPVVPPSVAAPSASGRSVAPVQEPPRSAVAPPAAPPAASAANSRRPSAPPPFVAPTPPVEPIPTPAPTPTPTTQPAPAEPPVVVSPPPPAPAPTPSPAPPPATVENPAAAINDLLMRYKAALEARNLGALKQIWPGLGGRQEAAIKAEFDNARAIAVTLNAITPSIAGTTATVTCHRDYVVTTEDRKTLKSATRMTMTLDRKNGAWLIKNIRHEAQP